MAPIPTIGNCVRVTLNWSTQGGVAPRNVFHLITASEDEVAIGLALDAAFTDDGADAFQALDDSYTLLSYSVMVLDGSSATQVVDATEVITGGGSGEMIPNAAAVLSMRTLQRGSRGRGRQYIGPISEAALTDGRVVGSYRLAMVAAWIDAEQTLAASPIAASFGVASYVHSEVSGVTSWSMREPAGTQRRRQNQLVV